MMSSRIEGVVSGPLPILVMYAPRGPSTLRPHYKFTYPEPAMSQLGQVRSWTRRFRPLPNLSLVPAIADLLICRRSLSGNVYCTETIKAGAPLLPLITYEFAEGSRQRTN